MALSAPLYQRDLRFRLEGATPHLFNDKIIKVLSDKHSNVDLRFEGQFTLLTFNRSVYAIYRPIAGIT